MVKWWLERMDNVPNRVTTARTDAVGRGHGVVCKKSVEELAKRVNLAKAT